MRAIEAVRDFGIVIVGSAGTERTADTENWVHSRAMDSRNSSLPRWRWYRDRWRPMVMRRAGHIGDIDRHVSARIRERRIRLGLSQQAIAQKVGVTYQQEHKYERGSDRISAGRLFLIAQVLRMARSLCALTAVGLAILTRVDAVAETRPSPAAPAVGQSFRDCADCPEMVVIPPGEFQMGDMAFPDSQPLHRVRVSHAFAIGKYPVTRGEYQRFVEATGRAAPRAPRFAQSDRDPVVNVSWVEAKAYVAWLSQVTGKAYRLPSEAEWEYAARAGTTTAYYWGNDLGSGHANCDGCGSQWDDRSTSPVGSFPPNPFGLFDMLGNVWQWVEDCGRDNYQGAPRDASLVVSFGNCAARVLRGGAWSYVPSSVRAGRRISLVEWGILNDVGFRVARTQ